MSIDRPNNITRSPEWAIDSLAAGGGGLRLGIPDTILFKDGAPQSWLFTSKSGEVLKKHSLRKSSIRDRFLRLFANNPNNPQQRVATVRSMDGTVRNLGKDSFEGVMTKFPATEPEVVSMQCYVQGKGNAGTVYRNSYRVVNDKGLVVTRTSSFTTLSALHSVAPPPICWWSERDIKIEKCNAPSISKALDKVTQGVVRFIEAEQDRPTRILHAHFDYVVDDFGRIWLTWIGETTAAVGKAAQDLRMAKVKIEGPHGRGDFLGPQTAPAMNREFGGPPAPVKKKCRLKHVAAAAAAASLSWRRKDIIEAVDRAAEITELPRGAVGAGGAGGIADALSRAEAVKEASPLSSSAMSLIVSSPTSASVVVRDQSAVRGSQARVLSTMTVGVRVGETSDDRSGGISHGDGRGYPGSLACVGDYCSIRVLVRSEGAFV